MKMFKYSVCNQIEELTIVNENILDFMYSITKEVVFTNRADAYYLWQKSDKKDSFTMFVLNNNLGIPLCYDDTGIDYQGSMVDDLLTHYEYVYIDEKLALKEDLQQFKSEYSYYSKRENKKIIFEEQKSDLFFIYEKEYDDYYTIQIWQDKLTNLYYKLLISELEDIPVVLGILDKQDAMEYIDIVNSWVEQEYISY